MTIAGLAVGILLVVLYVVFLLWHSQGRGKLTSEEIDRYMETIGQLPLPEEEIEAIVSRLRPWAESDDGKPVFMFNLIRFFDKIRTFQGAPKFEGTPEEANTFYEKAITWLWLRHASYPTFGGSPQSRNLINMQPEREWGRVAIARYPSRRTFLKLLADPSYAPMEPYKFIALEIDLVPCTGEMVVPDLRLVVGSVFLITFLAVNWILAII